jgi:hypothetical protein
VVVADSVFHLAAAERAVGWRLGIHRHRGILHRRFPSPEWSLTLLSARLLGIVDRASFGKGSGSPVLCLFQPLIFLEKFGILAFQFTHQGQQLFPAQVFDRRFLFSPRLLREDDQQQAIRVYQTIQYDFVPES